MIKKRTIIQTIKDGAGNIYHIPPRKKRVFKNNLVLRFVIPKVIPSKKNCQVPSWNRNRAEKVLKNHLGKPVTLDLIEIILSIKPYIRSSNRYKNWEGPASEDLVLQAARWKKTYSKHGLNFPITKATISIYHYWKDDVARDNSNKAESIHDTLVLCGILSDDKHQCLYKNTAEADIYPDSILDHLTIFHLTAHEW